MRLNRDKMNHLSHLVIKTMEKDSTISLLEESNMIRLNIVGIINDEIKIDDDVDKIVHAKLGSYSKKPLQGSLEWEFLYQKFYEEEMNKRGR